MVNMRCARVKLVVLGFASTLLVTACGGGSDAPDHGNDDANARSASVFESMPSDSAPAIAPLAMPSVAAIADVADYSRQLAVNGMKGLMTDGDLHSLRTVSPPLLLANLSLLTAGASNQTLRELTQAFPPKSSVASWLSWRSSVSRELWADVGSRYAFNFLSQANICRSELRRANCYGAEVGLSDNAVLADQDALKRVSDVQVEFLSLSHHAKTRLMAIDWSHLALEWGAVETFAGKFYNTSDSRIGEAEFLALTEGAWSVVSHGAKINGVMRSGLTVLTIMPNQGNLYSFLSSGQLDSAIATGLSGVKQGRWPAGAQPERLLLPKGRFNVASSMQSIQRSAGVRLAYSEALADFRSVDGFGGIYIDDFMPTGHLDISSLGLDLREASKVEFIFSPQNQNFNPGGSNFLGLNSTFIENVTALCLPADLRSFFLVLADKDGVVLSLTAIEYMGGGNSVRCK